MEPPVGYFDIIKLSFKVTNRNLLAILVQILYVIAILAVLAVMALLLIAMFAGSIAGLGEAALDPENLMEILKSSVAVIFTAIIFGFLFIIIAALLNAVAQSGIIGCLVRTARGEAGGFSSAAFFSSVKSSAMSLFWLQVLVSVIGIGVVLVFVLLGVAGFGLVLLPLKEAGNLVAAFAVGVPLLVVLILAALISFFLLYAGGMLSQVSLVAGVRGAVSAVGDTYDFIKSRFWDAMLFTLLVVFLLFGSNMLIELTTLPFRLFSGGESIAKLVWLLPILFVSGILKMYVGLFALSCFVVYYVSATTPPALEPEPAGAGPLPAAGQAEDVLDAELIEPE